MKNDFIIQSKVEKYHQKISSKKEVILKSINHSYLEFEKNKKLFHFPERSVKHMHTRQMQPVRQKLKGV